MASPIRSWSRIHLTRRGFWEHRNRPGDLDEGRREPGATQVARGSGPARQPEGGAGRWTSCRPTSAADPSCCSRIPPADLDRTQGPGRVGRRDPCGNVAVAADGPDPDGTTPLSVAIRATRTAQTSRQQLAGAPVGRRCRRGRRPRDRDAAFAAGFSPAGISATVKRRRHPRPQMRLHKVCVGRRHRENALRKSPVGRRLDSARCANPPSVADA
jgi:hypothetical protein